MREKRKALAKVQGNVTSHLFISISIKQNVFV